MMRGGGGDGAGPEVPPERRMTRVKRALKDGKRQALEMRENIRSRVIRIKGHDVRYYTAGQGEPLVVIHGGLGDASTWLDNVHMLADYYTVYVPDLPGFGASQLLDREHDIPAFTDFVEDFTDNLGLDRFNLVGHSIGGGVALNYALRFPGKVKKLVLVSSLCLGREIAPWVRMTSVLARAIGSAMESLSRATRWMIDTLMLPVKLVRPLSRASVNLGSNITTLKEQTLVLTNRLSALAMPTLLVWGARDEIVPVKHAYAAVQVIPDCQLRVFARRGHNVHRDEMDKFSNLLTGFLG
jgi:pimeloyl-ACP methyl ester carboxylesterase